METMNARPAPTVTARLEAMETLEKATTRLESDAPITPLDRRLLVAMLEHAKGCVERIQELKRVRRTAGKGETE